MGWLQQEFDDIVPYTFHGVPGFIIPPPHWQDNPVYRIAMTTGIASRDVTGRLTMAFRLWIVKHGEPPVRTYRDFSMRPQLLVHLPETARRIWRDHVTPTAWLIVHVVRPTPMAEPDGIRLMHVILEVNRPRTCGVQPVLIASRQ